MSFNQCFRPQSRQTRLFVFLASATTWASSAGARSEPSLIGSYLCTAIDKAGIRSIHLEGSGSPASFASKRPPTRFRIAINADGADDKKFRLSEIAYTGTDRDQAEWEDENTVLHETYVGEGGLFQAPKGPAFFTLSKSTSATADGDFEFYHAGFEFAGGEDMLLSVRWGRCMKES